MQWTTTRDGLSVGLHEDSGDICDAMGRVVASITKCDPRHLEADRAALAFYFDVAPSLTLKEFKARWVRVRKLARNVLDTDNNGLRATPLTREAVFKAATR